MDRIRSETVDLHHVAEEDNRYRISSEQPVDNLSESIASVGLITPPILQEESGKYIIIAGFRRIAACRRLGWSRIDARLLPADADPLDGIRLAIADNAFHRRLNLIEQARAASKLSFFYDDDTVLCRDARNIGLVLNPLFIGKLRQLARLDEKLQRVAAGEIITLDIALKMGSLGQVSIDLLIDLFDHLRPTVSQQKEIFTHLSELAALNDKTVADVLQNYNVQQIINKPGINRRKKISALCADLKKLRYPVISLWERQYQHLISNLELPSGLVLIPPENFEGSRFRMILTFENPDQLHMQQRYIGSLIHHPEFVRIINKEIADQTNIY